VRTRKASLFFGDLRHYPMAAQLCVLALELPELKWFLADDAR
jgi:hypothetical protein